MVRIGGVGCLLNLNWIVEICEQIDLLLDFNHSDQRAGIVGSLSFRQTRIPVVDPTLFLGLDSHVAIGDRTALVLGSSEGNWAFVVDQVVEICPADRLVACEIPLLLKSSVAGYYSKIELFREEPVIVLDPEYFYGSAVGV